MKEIFEKIWELALPYQDKRDDEGHARSVTDFAFELLKTESADEDILIPAAILHDIGWSQLSEEERFYVFKNKITKEVEMKTKSKVNVRVKHELEGAKLAQKILEKVDYDKNRIKKIIKVIKQHDTGKNIISPEDRLMRDADKLWSFSKLGFQADIRRFGLFPKECYEMAVKRVDMPNYFNTESAKKIARKELEKNKIKFMDSAIKELEKEL